LYGIDFVFMGLGLLMVCSGPGEGGDFCGALVHNVTEPAAAADVDTDGVDLDSGCECALKAARKLPRNGRWVGMISIRRSTVPVVGVVLERSRASPAPQRVRVK